jgi:hypothetical protein
VEVSLSHTVLLVGMGDGMVTHKHMDRRISVVTQKEPCSPPLDRRVRHQNGNVGIDLRPRADQDVDIAQGHYSRVWALSQLGLKKVAPHVKMGLTPNVGSRKVTKATICWIIKGVK